MPDETPPTDYLSPTPTETPGESSVFPVSKEAVLTALTAISEDPESVYILTLDQLKNENTPLLNPLLVTYARRSGLNAEALYEGALWTYKILGEQATMKRTKIPQISHAEVVVYAKSLDESVAGSNETFGQFTEGQIGKIAQTDEHFGNGIKKMGEFRVDRIAFYAGAAQTYLALQKKAEAVKMNQQLGIH